MKSIKLVEVPREHYPLPFSYDEAYQLLNENNVPIGIIYVSQLPFGDEIYIEWVEILSVFRGMGYLRHILNAVKETLQTNIQFQCDEKLRKKYLSIGCIEHGISECTENYIMSY